MSEDLIAVIDVETTGLSPWRHDRVVEIAIVLLTPDGTVHFEYETLLNPHRDMGPSRIHQIYASDVLKAPSFSEVAGDILEILAKSSVVAGHNVAFDKNFLIKEYERIGVTIPNFPALCTCQLFGRSSLASCCKELGIEFKGMPHRALSDARVTSHLVSVLCNEDPSLLKKHCTRNLDWPQIPILKTPCFRREIAQQARDEPPRFLERIASQIRHDVEAEMPTILAYLALIDRVLEDRNIDTNEETAIVDAALSWQLSASQLDSAHRQYIHNLAFHALADGVVTESERSDLHAVARLLGQDDTMLDSLLESASTQLAATRSGLPIKRTESELQGLSVCFTGELNCTLGGQPITRNIAEALATQAGLTVVGSVTKSLNLLVVADPTTQSGKAAKARGFGTRILSEAVFWRLTGAIVD